MMNFWGMCGAISAGLAVILGAFAAHVLDTEFGKTYAEAPAKIVAGHPIPASHKALADFKTGAEYQFYHALGMLMVGLYATRKPSRLLSVAGWSFLLGTLLFSGSLYLLTLLQQPKLGMIAPIGGTLFIVGWFCLASGICGCCGCGKPSLPEK